MPSPCRGAQYLAKGGAPSEACVRYRALKTDCPLGCDEASAPFDLYRAATAYTRTAANHTRARWGLGLGDCLGWGGTEYMQDIMQHGPAYMAMLIYGDFLWYHTGIYSPTTTGFFKVRRRVPEMMMDAWGLSGMLPEPLPTPVLVSLEPGALGRTALPQPVRVRGRGFSRLPTLSCLLDGGPQPLPARWLGPDAVSCLIPEGTPTGAHALRVSNQDSPALGLGGPAWSGPLLLEVLGDRCQPAFAVSGCGLAGNCTRPVAHGPLECVCEAGWSGPACTTLEGECSVAADCQHNGTCAALAPHKQCVCAPGWGGPQCAIHGDAAATVGRMMGWVVTALGCACLLWGGALWTVLRWQTRAPPQLLGAAPQGPSSRAAFGAPDEDLLLPPGWPQEEEGPQGRLRRLVLAGLGAPQPPPAGPRAACRGAAGAAPAGGGAAGCGACRSLVGSPLPRGGPESLDRLGLWGAPRQPGAGAATVAFPLGGGDLPGGELPAAPAADEAALLVANLLLHRLLAQATYLTWVRLPARPLLLSATRAGGGGGLGAGGAGGALSPAWGAFVGTLRWAALLWVPRGSLPEAVRAMGGPAGPPSTGAGCPGLAIRAEGLFAAALCGTLAWAGLALAGMGLLAVLLALLRPGAARPAPKGAAGQVPVTAASPLKGPPRAGASRPPAGGWRLWGSSEPPRGGRPAHADPPAPGALDPWTAFALALAVLLGLGLFLPLLVWGLLAAHRRQSDNEEAVLAVPDQLLQGGPHAGRLQPTYWTAGALTATRPTTPPILHVGFLFGWRLLIGGLVGGLAGCSAMWTLAGLLAALFALLFDNAGFPFARAADGYVRDLLFVVGLVLAAFVSFLGLALPFPDALWGAMGGLFAGWLFLAHAVPLCRAVALLARATALLAGLVGLQQPPRDTPSPRPGPGSRRPRRRRCRCCCLPAGPTPGGGLRGTVPLRSLPAPRRVAAGSTSGAEPPTTQGPPLETRPQPQPPPTAGRTSPTAGPKSRRADWILAEAPERLRPTPHAARSPLPCDEATPGKGHRSRSRSRSPPLALPPPLPPPPRGAGLFSPPGGLGAGAALSSPALTPALGVFTAAVAAGPGDAGDGPADGAPRLHPAPGSPCPPSSSLSRRKVALSP
ncbi:hypothetical protein PAPYR_5130 [Paratrimastix pyriformis]|uniref:EGF-like domain-containing protein n=1 Tax=Paratrimastix pyriformis TaxID=342808 RepID=A0ABQ8UIL0_9EUKA|nr:hypothetical protein PAPYR_5130 [Paratrimastix pyriformis]